RPRRNVPLVRLGVPVTPTIGPPAFGLRDPANPHAALAARRGIFVRRRFSSAGRTVRAAGSHRRVARLLTVVASALQCTGAAWRRLSVSPAAADLLRPSA